MTSNESMIWLYGFFTEIKIKPSGFCKYNSDMLLFIYIII